MTEDEMVGWHHQLNGHGFGWTPGVGDGQGGLACCDSWGRKESDTAEQLNGTGLSSLRKSWWEPEGGTKVQRVREVLSLQMYVNSDRAERGQAH